LFLIFFFFFFFFFYYYFIQFNFIFYYYHYIYINLNSILNHIQAAFARFRSLWYLAITIIGYYCLKDVEYLPRTLGGKARFEDLNLFWDGLPYQPQDRKVVVYYMIQFGSALCTFILQFKQNRTRNS